MENVKLANVNTVKTGVLRDQLVTLGDLENFKQEIFCEIKLLLKDATAPPAPRKWLKSYEVRQMLNLSAGTLQTLRTNGTLPYSRIGGAIYYDYEDIQQLLSAGKRNSLQMAVVKKR